MVVMGIIHGGKSFLKQALDLLGDVIGPLELLDESWPFDWSDYYNSEMGTELFRCFAVCERLFERDALAELKLLTNRVEGRLATSGGNRRVNLDPGLLGLENFVLASTKRQPQRVYLKRGIWAESTLWYINGGFVPHERTYPDYRDERVRAVLDRLRDRYKNLLRKDVAQVATTAMELERLLREEFN